MAQAFILGRDFVGGRPSALVLGDNIFYGHDFQILLSIEKKPAMPKSDYAVTGLYFYKQQVRNIAASIRPSARGELEITEVNAHHLRLQQLAVETVGRGYAWMDTDTHDSMMETSQFIATLENSHGMKVACPEEIAFRVGWIVREQLAAPAKPMLRYGYGQYLLQVAGSQVFL